VTPLDTVDGTLVELAARREAAIVGFRDALDGAPMPDPDAFTLSAAIDRHLDRRLSVAAYLAAVERGDWLNLG
jgi:hypothetical protein